MKKKYTLKELHEKLCKSIESRQDSHIYASEFLSDLELEEDNISAIAKLRVRNSWSAKIQELERAIADAIYSKEHPEDIASYKHELAVAREILRELEDSSSS